MSALKEKLTDIDPDYIEEAIALTPTYMITELIGEYEPTLEKLIKETLKIIIKDIREETKRRARI